MYTDNNKPFVSVPFSKETGLMQNPAAGNVQTTLAPAMDDRMANEYPEIYHEIYPMITDAVERLMAAGYEPTPEMINSMVDAIIKNSGMWYEDDDEESMVEAIPVQFGSNRNPYRRRRRGHHNRNSLRDIVRILLLRELFDRRGHRPHSGYSY